ncbi:MAG: hypothetical protein PHD29_05530 [bacterium]|nr:hypothetical protein [bacterium]MDD5353631.1 hypothetical protein [bacterium]MDD5756511.1 hypothetical protein [bacterium]
MNKYRSYLFISLLLIYGITFFTRNDYHGITEIVPEALKEPIQKPVLDLKPITFSKDGYAYELTPRFDYTVSALLVHKLNYKRFSIYKYASVFPMDVSLVWGSNLATKVYQSKKLRFWQDGRFTYWQYEAGLEVDSSEIANEHLIINDKALERKMNSLNVGDQVRIKGKLVDVVATNTGQANLDKPSLYKWQTSTVRTDTGPGACEIIYVEDIEILKKGNPVSYVLFNLSFYGIIILGIWFIAELFI